MAVNKEVEKLLQAVLKESTELILQKIRDKSISPSELQAAVALLRTNGVTIEIKEGTPLAFLRDELPFVEMKKAVNE